MAMWQNLEDMCAQVRLIIEPDRVKCSLTKPGELVVESCYRYLVARRVGTLENESVVLASDPKYNSEQSKSSEKGMEGV